MNAGVPGAFAAAFLMIGAGIYLEGELMIKVAIVALALMQSEPSDREIVSHIGEHEWSGIDVSEKLVIDEDNPKKPPQVLTIVSRRQLCFQHAESAWKSGVVWLLIDEYANGVDGMYSKSRRPVAYTGRYRMSPERDSTGDVTIKMTATFRRKYVGTANGTKWKWEFDPKLTSKEIVTEIPIGDPQRQIESIDLLVVSGEEGIGQERNKLSAPNEAFARHFCNIGDTLRLKRGSMLRSFIGKSLPPGFAWNEKEKVMSDGDVEAMLKDTLKK